VGTSTPLEYATKMRLAQEAASSNPRVSVPASALLAKRLVSARAPARLRNVGKKGRILGVRYTVSHGDHESKALVFVTGPFQLIERGTKPHPIPKLKNSGKSRAANPVFGPAFGGVNMKKIVSTPYGPRRMVWHPGTKGQHPFEKGVAEAQPLIQRAQRDILVTELRAIF